MGCAMRLMVVHQNWLFRECLTSVLSDCEQFDAVELDHSDPERLNHLESCRPDVVLIDLSLPHRLALQLIQQIRKAAPETKLIVLVAAHTEEVIVECVQMGADGCVLEEASLEDLKSVIDLVHRGETYCSPQIANSMFAQLGKLVRENRWSQRIESATLTARELDVLRLIADERLSNKQIARLLCLSLYTVKNHVHNILEKLQVHNRYEAAEYAYEQHLLA